MGAKGRKRREKNYRAAHGGNYTRLPPPPDPSQVDAVPSKLRKLLSFASSPHHRADEVVSDRRKRGGAEKMKLQKRPSHDAVKSKAKAVEGRGRDGNKEDGREEENRKRKRTRGKVEDLRFETSALEGTTTKTREKRRQRKKKYLEAKKKKHKKSNAEENADFPGREQIKFGDVVQAPPKLIALPKAMKNTQDASKERLRLQAIEAYRNRRGLTSRLGIQLPSLDITPSL